MCVGVRIFETITVPWWGDKVHLLNDIVNKVKSRHSQKLKR